MNTIRSCLILSALLPAPGWAQDTPGAPAPVQSLAGTLLAYECDAECLLVVLDGAGTQRRGLCLAQPCERWTADRAIPADLLGRAVLLRVESAPSAEGPDGQTGAGREVYTGLVFTDEEQAAAPDLGGAWFLAQADGPDPGCLLVFDSTGAATAGPLAASPECAQAFAFLTGVSGWRAAADQLQVLDGAGQVLIEFRPEAAGRWRGSGSQDGLGYLLERLE